MLSPTLRLPVSPFNKASPLYYPTAALVYTGYFYAWYCLYSSIIGARTDHVARFRSEDPLKTKLDGPDKPKRAYVIASPAIIPWTHLWGHFSLKNY